MENQKGQIICEYLRGGVGTRELAKKYGVSHTTIANWIRTGLTKEERLAVLNVTRAQKQENAMNTEELLNALREAQLRNKLLEAMIDIGEEQYGIEIRKKSGTRRS